jgi:adhesin/invasin
VNGVDAVLQAISSDSNTISFQVPAQTALGPAQFVVSRTGVSSAPFQFTVSPFAPMMLNSGGGLARMLHGDGTTVNANSPATPGEKVKCVVSGLGAKNPPAVPQLFVGGIPTTVEAILANDGIFNFPGVYGLVFVVPTQLPSGSASLFITFNNLSSVVLNIPIQSSGLTLSQTGATFRAVLGTTTPLQRTISVISTSQPISWTASAATVSGGNWLQVSPSTGISDPAKPAPTITITATVGQLQQGDYYGTVSIKSSNVLEIVSVVLSISAPTASPGPVVEPTGLVFIGSPGSAAPAAKSVKVSNPTAAPLTFTATSTFSGPTTWFTFQPATGTVTPGTPITLTVQPSAGLANGNQTGTITLTFSDRSVRVVNLLIVFATGAPSGGSIAERPAGCAPTKLFPVFTLLGVNFSSPVAWPANIDVFVNDDCGAPITSGTVSASFSNGDPPLGLIPLGDGHWATTWTPRNPVDTNLKVTATAAIVSPALNATTTITGNAPANPNVPIVFSGGVVGTASYVASPSPGTLISIFGAELADDLFISPQVPRPTQILTTQIILGGAQVPMLFVSKGQVNALLPYALKTKTNYQLIVQRGSAISTPETIAILDSQPAVFSVDLSGKGQGHIYKIGSDGSQTLAAPGNAVTAGDILTVYCAGLGEVNPPATAGSPAPLDKLEPAVNAVTGTIGGQNAQILFAGLTPGFTGLYQVNMVVPGGVTPGDTVPLVLMAAGQVSQAVTMAVK